MPRHCSTLLVCGNSRGWQMTQKFTLQCHQETIIQCKPRVSALNEFRVLMRQSFLLLNKDTSKVIHIFFFKKKCLLRKEPISKKSLPSFWQQTCGLGLCDVNLRSHMKAVTKSAAISSGKSTGLKDSHPSRSWSSGLNGLLQLFFSSYRF